jgi:2-succinyl-5-enolpyruvyl-6-hydroxy-3-cyclohexene-1-carboxylate synthase
MKPGHIAEVLIDQLVIQGVGHVFCIPGESYIAALDALHDRAIAVTVCRQEGGAAMLAEAVGKATGRPSICFVTRGPGATNAAAGLHVARQDSTPMILFVGQIARDMREREAFQELDYRAVFGTIAKWTTEIDDPSRIPELISRAFYATTAAGQDRWSSRFRRTCWSSGSASRTPGLRAGGGLAGPDRHGPAAEAPPGRAQARGARRRQPVIGARLCRVATLR